MLGFNLLSLVASSILFTGFDSCICRHEAAWVFVAHAEVLAAKLQPRSSAHAVICGSNAPKKTAQPVTSVAPDP